MATAREQRQKWLVGMSVKATGEVRLGCGLYHWQFQPESGRVEHLQITIEPLQVSPAERLRPVMDWLQPLPCPWCPAHDLLGTAPPLENIAAVLAYLHS